MGKTTKERGTYNLLGASALVKGGSEYHKHEKVPHACLPKSPDRFYPTQVLDSWRGLGLAEGHWFYQIRD